MAGNGRGDARPRDPGRNGIECYRKGIEAEVFQRRRRALQHLGVHSAGQWRPEEFLGRNTAVDDGRRNRTAISTQSATSAGIAQTDASELQRFAADKKIARHRSGGLSTSYRALIDYGFPVPDKLTTCGEDPAA